MNAPMTQSLQSLTLLSQALTDLSKGGLEHQPIDSLLKVADQIRSIAQVGEPLQAQIQASLTELLQEEQQQVALQRSQALLLEIVSQCKGMGQPACSLKKLGSDLRQWQAQVEKLLRQVEQITMQQSLQTECQHLYQRTQDMQHQAIALELENPRKLDLLRQLIDLEKNVGAIEQGLQRGKRDGQEDQEKLAQVKRAIEDMQLTYGLAADTSASP